MKEIFKGFLKGVKIYRWIFEAGVWGHSSQEIRIGCFILKTLVMLDFEHTVNSYKEFDLSYHIWSRGCGGCNPGP